MLFDYENRTFPECLVILSELSIYTHPRSVLSLNALSTKQPGAPRISAPRISTFRKCGLCLDLFAGRLPNLLDF